MVDQLRATGGLAVAEVQQQLGRHVHQLWGRGYGPLDLLHVVDRKLGADHAQLAADTVDRMRSGRADRWPGQWQSEADEVASTTPGTPVTPHTLAAGIELLALVLTLPEVPPTGRGDAPAPSSWLDDAVLAKVRGLLRKAESTEFDAEAEALTAKAHQLITRHAIDEALLQDGEGRATAVAARRIRLHDPYLSQKFDLVSAVAGANRCVTVFNKGLGWGTVFGHNSDLDATELMATSLLAQALGAMARLGSVRDADGRLRTRSFRSGFLRGFANQIADRLEQAGATVTDGADRRALPVLASRQDAAREAAEAAYPGLTTIRRRRVTNGEGYMAGVGAANLASLTFSQQELR